MNRCAFLTYITINNYIITDQKFHDGDITPSSCCWDVLSFSFFEDEELPIGVTFSFLIGFGGACGVSSPRIGTAFMGPSPETTGLTFIAVFCPLPA